MSVSRKVPLAVFFCMLVLVSYSNAQKRKDRHSLTDMPVGYEVSHSGVDGIYPFTVRSGTFSQWMAETFVDIPNLFGRMSMPSAVGVTSRMVADLDEITVRRILSAPNSVVNTKTPLEDLSAGITYEYVYCAEADAATAFDCRARAQLLLDKVTNELRGRSTLQDRTWLALAHIALVRLKPDLKGRYDEYRAAAGLKPFKYPHLDAFVDRGVYDELVLQKRYSEASHARALLMKKYKAYRGWQILLL